MGRIHSRAGHLSGSLSLVPFPLASLLGFEVAKPLALLPLQVRPARDPEDERDEHKDCDESSHLTTRPAEDGGRVYRGGIE